MLITLKYCQVFWGNTAETKEHSESNRALAMFFVTTLMIMKCIVSFPSLADVHDAYKS